MLTRQRSNLRTTRPSSSPSSGCTGSASSSGNRDASSSRPGRLVRCSLATQLSSGSVWPCRKGGCRTRTGWRDDRSPRHCSRRALPPPRVASTGEVNMGSMPQASWARALRLPRHPQELATAPSPRNHPRLTPSAHLDGRAHGARVAAQRAHLGQREADAAGMEPFSTRVAAQHGHCRGWGGWVGEERDGMRDSEQRMGRAVVSTSLHWRGGPRQGHGGRRQRRGAQQGDTSRVTGSERGVPSISAAHSCSAHWLASSAGQRAAGRGSTARRGPRHGRARAACCAW